MSPALLSGDVREALAGDMTPKFLATLGPSGQPNCVPVITICPYDDDTLVFGEFMLNKSRDNLLGCDKVGVAVITESLHAWSLKGTFLGFETTGPRVEFVNQLPTLRYNAYTSIRSAGLIRVEDVSAEHTASRLSVLTDYLAVRALAPLFRRGVREDKAMPRQVAEKFSRISAVRAIAHRDHDGYPRAFPVMTCVPVHPARLLLAGSLFRACQAGITPGAGLAASVLTMDPIAYQVKGVYAGATRGIGAMDIRESYSASPPLVGKRLDP